MRTMAHRIRLQNISALSCEIQFLTEEEPTDPAAADPEMQEFFECQAANQMAEEEQLPDDGDELYGDMMDRLPDDTSLDPDAQQHLVPAWFAAKLFGRALNFEGGAPLADVGMSSFLTELGLDTDALSWPIRSPATTTMADVLALRAAIIGQDGEWPDHRVWSTLDAVAPSLGRACRSRGGVRNKLMAIAKACLTGHWMCALFCCAHCQNTASLIALLDLHLHTCSIQRTSMRMCSQL